jgi:hypothetical protein
LARNVAQMALELNGQTNNESINKEVPKTRSNKGKVKPVLEENDIRFIVNRGIHRKLSTEESLIEAGIIKECHEILSHL